MTLDLFDKRTLLFLPASNPRAIMHARESHADIVILDLEDAVKPADKDSARDAAIEAIFEPWPMPVAIRVNASGTQWHGPDVVAVMHKKPDLVVVPRVESKEDLTWWSCLGSKARRTWVSFETRRACRCWRWSKRLGVS
jgi:citrate lyase beta subunit